MLLCDNRLNGICKCCSPGREGCGIPSLSFSQSAPALTIEISNGNLCRTSFSIYSLYLEIVLLGATLDNVILRVFDRECLFIVGGSDRK